VTLDETASMLAHWCCTFGLAVLLILGLCTALAGQSMPMSDYTLSTSDGLSVSLSADGQVTSAQIAGGDLVSVPAPALLVRDLSDAGSVVAPNLVANPGFEDGPAGWVRYANSGLDVNVVVSPTHSGDAALQFAHSNDGTVTARSTQIFQTWRNDYSWRRSSFQRIPGCNGSSPGYG